MNVEVGRHDNIVRTQRLCTMCSFHDIEDEFHFILKCPLYGDLRKKYIKNFYYTKPSVFKLVKLLSVQNTRELNNLGKYLQFATKLRKLHV